MSAGNNIVLPAKGEFEDQAAVVGIHVAMEWGPEDVDGCAVADVEMISLMNDCWGVARQSKGFQERLGGNVSRGMALEMGADVDGWLGIFVEDFRRRR